MRYRVGAIAAASVGASSSPVSFRHSELADSRKGVSPPTAQHLWASFVFAKPTIEVKCEMSTALTNQVVATQKMKEMEKSIDFKKEISKCELFRDMNTDILALAERVGHKLWFKKGSLILQEDEVNDSIFLVGIGKLNVLVGQNPVATLNKGDCFGETAVITRRKANASIKVASDNALVFAVSHDELREVLSTSAWEKIADIANARELANVSYTFLKDVPVFSEASSEFLQACVKALKLVTFETGTQMLTMGVADTEGMFFIRSGEVSIFDAQGPVASLKENDVVGETMLMAGPGMKRSCSVRATTFVEAYQLTKPDFLQLATKYPKDFEAMKATSKARSRQNLSRATRVRNTL